MARSGGAGRGWRRGTAVRCPYRVGPVAGGGHSGQGRHYFTCAQGPAPRGSSLPLLRPHGPPVRAGKRQDRGARIHTEQREGERERERDYVSLPRASLQNHTCDTPCKYKRVTVMHDQTHDILSCTHAWMHYKNVVHVAVQMHENKNVRSLEPNGILMGLKMCAFLSCITVRTWQGSQARLVKSLAIVKETQAGPLGSDGCLANAKPRGRGKSLNGETRRGEARRGEARLDQTRISQ